MHWIRTDKVNSVCERGRFRTIKKLIVFPARYMIRYDYDMTIIIICNYYYLLLTNGQNLFNSEKKKDKELREYAK